MKKILSKLFPLTLFFIIYFLPRIGTCLEDYVPIEKCTAGISMDEFLAEFKLEKINKIVFKKYLYDKETKTITTLSEKQKIISVISSFKKAKCSGFCLCSCDYEMWLYEDANLYLKVAISVSKKSLAIRFYRPNHFQEVNDELGDIGYGFYILDEKLSSWLYTLLGLEKHESPRDKY